MQTSKKQKHKSSAMLAGLLSICLTFTLLATELMAQESQASVMPPKPGMTTIEEAFRDHTNVASLVSALLQNNMQRARALISDGAKIDAKGTNGLRPIHIAALYGNDAGVANAIALGAKVDVATDHHETPLQYALYPIRNGDVFRALVKSGANVTWASEETKLSNSLSLGQMILASGIQFGRNDEEKIDLYWFYLENGGDIDELNADGISMVTSAFNQFNYDFVTKLLDRQANPYAGSPSLINLLDSKEYIPPPKKLAESFDKMIVKVKKPRDTADLQAKAQEQMLAHRKFRERYEQTRRYQAENEQKRSLEKIIQAIEKAE